MINIHLNDINDAQSSFQLLNVLSDTHAWLKDTNGKFVCANQLFLQRFRFNHLDELKGKCDEDLSPPHMANEYVEDDQLVLSGEVITDRLELINKYDEEATWFLTSKWPVYNLDDMIIGTFGASRHLNKTDISITPFRELQTPIEYIRKRFMEAITVKQLADISHISVSALERRFKKHLGKTPHQFITDTRLDRARHLLLESNTCLSDIAHLVGFSDHSHFTRTYSKRFKVAPSIDRKRHEKSL